MSGDQVAPTEPTWFDRHGQEWRAAPQVAPTEPPTWQQAEDVYGFDAMREPLRAAAPDRCDECGGLVKGFFANFLRRCPNDWHIVREEWEHGLGPAPQGEGNTDE